MANASSAACAPCSDVSFKDMSNAIRALAMDAVEKAKSGHPGMPMGMADVATVLFTEFLKFDPKHPQWPDRDRFILSAGHGSMLMYALLYLNGYEDMTLEDIKNFRQLGAKTAGHPEFGHAQGIETTTGPLGQGIANAVGFAMAERALAAKYGNEIVNHKTYVIAGDGCLMEGISQEAITLAGHLKLSQLVVLWDDNGISIDGPISLSSSEDMHKRFEAAGWAVDTVDGHDAAAIRKAIAAAQNATKPTMIACKTTIGFGAPSKAGKSSSHGSPLGADEIKGARENLGWAHEAFEIPAEILNAWREAGARGAADFEAWTKRFEGLSADAQSEFSGRVEGALPSGWEAAYEAAKKNLCENPVSEATRQSSGAAINVLAPHIPALLGGSADLTGSNLTKASDAKPFAAPDYSGNYIYYGIREHGMAAAMNGMALHGGIIPFGGTFMVFTDYCRPSIRLSALMEQRVIYVMTHDSIGLGEDGPTHQPVEHLAALRCIPNLNVFRPCDAVETLEAWALSVSDSKTPSVLSLTRQKTKQQRTEYTKENKTALGGYVLKEASAAPKVVVIASGSEVELAVEAQEHLEKDGVPTRVVSLPCWELFFKQPASYQQEVLGKNTFRIGIEAAGGFGWERILGERGQFIGMPGFGASAPAPELYKHFGITADAIVKTAKDNI